MFNLLTKDLFLSFIPYFSREIQLGKYKVFKSLELVQLTNFSVVRFLIDIKFFNSPG